MVDLDFIDDHKPAVYIGVFAFFVSAGYSALRGAGWESLTVGLFIGALTAGLVEMGIRKWKGE